jgi:hypothetical protein
MEGRYLGDLCPLGHDAGGGVSIRRRSNRACIVCERVKGNLYYRQDRGRHLALKKKRREQSLETYRKVEKARAAIRRKNPQYREYSNQYYAKNSVRIALRNRFHRALKAYSTHGKLWRVGEYGVSIDAIAAHLGPCPGPRGEWHIDHIRPLVSFDLTDPDQVRQAFAPENHQWLPAKENISKGGRYASSGP